MPFAQLAILIGVALLLVLALFALFVFGRSKQVQDNPDLEPGTYIDQYERPSSIASEQIEDIARRNLEQYPDLADVVFDFGTAADGSIDIWVNRNRYDDVEDIPDERIRKAIKEAIEAYNQSL